MNFAQNILLYDFHIDSIEISWYWKFAINTQDLDKSSLKSKVKRSLICYKCIVILMDMVLENVE
jgi:hypothetical protein